MNDERRPEDAAATVTLSGNGNTGSGDRLLTAAELGGRTSGSPPARSSTGSSGGDLPGYRLFGRKGGPVRFRASDVERFLEGCRGGGAGVVTDLAPAWSGSLRRAGAARGA